MAIFVYLCKCFLYGCMCGWV